MVDKQRLELSLRNRRQLYAAIWAANLVTLLPQFHPLQVPIEVVVASIGTGADLRSFRRGVDRAVTAASAEADTYSSVLGLGMLDRMMLDTSPLVITSRAGTPDLEPGLQVADYCTWAIRRRWERPSEAAWAYGLIQHQVVSESTSLIGVG